MILHDALSCASPAYLRLSKTRLQHLLNPISYLGTKSARLRATGCICASRAASSSTVATTLWCTVGLVFASHAKSQRKPATNEVRNEILE